MLVYRNYISNNPLDTAKEVLAAQNLADFATSALGLISDPQKEDEQTA